MEGTRRVSEKVAVNTRGIQPWRRWGKEFPTPAYFDYFYSGCDVRVRFSEMPSEDSIDSVPIVALGFSVTQQKVPLYGFWSYTFDGVALGTRIIQGTFAIPFQGPQYMYYLLSEAAKKYDKMPERPRPTTDDEINLQQYWGKTRDEKHPLTKHMFLSHPPFDIIISYGQESFPQDKYFQAFPLEYGLSTKAGDEIYYDINERFINPDDVYKRPRIFIEHVQLTTMGMQIEPTGQPLMEAYSFFARDTYWEEQEEFLNNK